MTPSICFTQQVIVIVHLTPRAANPVESLACLTQNRQPDFPISIGQLDVFPSVSARTDVAKASGKFESWRACHARSMAYAM